MRVSGFVQTHHNRKCQNVDTRQAILVQLKFAILQRYSISFGKIFSRVAPDSDFARYPANIFPDTGYPAKCNFL